MSSVEQMVQDAMQADVRNELRERKQKLVDACMVEPNYDNPFGYADGVGEKIDELVQLITPSLNAMAANRVYRRMAKMLRND